MGARRHAALPERPRARRRRTGHRPGGWEQDRRRLMPHIATYVRLVHEAEKTLAESFRVIADGQAKHPDVYHTCRLLAEISDRHESRLAPIRERYGEEARQDLQEPQRVQAA